MMCPKCGCDQITTWSEPSLLVVPPEWWPENQPYNPPQQESTHQLCMHCGWHQEVIA